MEPLSDEPRPGLAGVVRQARRERGLTQVELARRAGMHPSYVSRIEGASWERGGPWPSDLVLRALARELGLSSTRLAKLKGEARPDGGSVERRMRNWPGPGAAGAAIGDVDVDALAARLIAAVPPSADLRMTGAALGPSARNALADRVAAHPAPGRGLRRVAGRRGALDVLIGEHEALVVVPAANGAAPAALSIDDPDMVAALRDWFDGLVGAAPPDPVRAAVHARRRARRPPVRRRC